MYILTQKTGDSNYYPLKLMYGDYHLKSLNTTVDEPVAVPSEPITLEISYLKSNLTVMPVMLPVFALTVAVTTAFE